MDRVQFTVSELNDYVNNVLLNDEVLKHVQVKGEISNYIFHTSGHRYFALKDKDGLVSCTMWRSDGASLTFEPKNGDKVVVNGYVGIYKQQGKYQIYVKAIKQEGIGSLYEKFELLKKKLLEQGYFDENHKKPLPLLPKKIGIVTSYQGAAIQDMINIITRRYENSYIVIYPAKVQGEGAHLSIMQGIAYFNSDPDVDVIIIGRGGGSLEDLWAFNEEELAMAVFNSEKPIISAVGHETDFAITDFIADLRAPTPSAAAELCVPVKLNIKNDLQSKENTLRNLMINNLNKHKAKAAECKLRLERFNPINRIAQQKQRIDGIVMQMESSISATVQRLKAENTINKQALNNSITFKLEQLKALCKNINGRLEALNPTAVLKRGYAIVENETGEALDSALKLKKNDKISLVFHDGSKSARVE